MGIFRGLVEFLEIQQRLTLHEEDGVVALSARWGSGSSRVAKRSR